MQNAEQPLRDAIQRLVRARSVPRAMPVLLVLRLSGLPPPAPRPYHRRIARAVLDDAARWADGQVHVMRNGDVAALLRAADGGAALTATMARLFRVDVPDPGALVTCWALPEGAAGALEYLDACAADAALPDAMDNAGPSPPGLAGIEALLDGTALPDLTHRQFGVRLGPGGVIEPAFHAVAFSWDVLAARVGAADGLGTDPFLARHIAARLDRRMLDGLGHAIETGGALAGGLGRDGPALHVVLSPRTVLSSAFDGFVAVCARRGLRVGVALPLIDACADAAVFVRARDRLHDAGMAFVLDGVSRHTLRLMAPASLQPDVVKLDWSPRLAEAGLDTAVQALGPGRIVLTRAATEAALRWGLANGIRMFQGRHVDAMLAAQRLEACAYARSCTLRQCIERASATGAAGRAGCFAPALLDGAVQHGLAGA